MKITEKKKDILKDVLLVILGGIISAVTSLYIYYGEKNGIETRTVETLAKYFDSVDNEMSYTEALETVYEESEKLKTEIKDLEEGNINPILIKKAKDYASSNDYFTALLILKTIEKPDSETSNLIKEYSQKYESEIIDQIDSYIDKNNVEEAKKLLNSSLEIIPDSEMLQNKKKEIDDNKITNMIQVVPAYQTGGNEYKEYDPSINGATESFSMGGIKYTNGMTFDADINIFNDASWAVYNLNGEYTSLSFVVGHVDGTDLGEETVLQVIFDGNIHKEIALQPDMYPQNETIDITGVKQMKLQVLSSGSSNPLYGIGNPVIQ